MNINYKPIIAITMGDPVGIGPEIIIKALNNKELYKMCKPIVLGDIFVLKSAQKYTGIKTYLKEILSPKDFNFNDCINVINISKLDINKVNLGLPSIQTGKAMIEYIIKSIDMALNKDVAAVVTCPINKKAMQMAGFNYNGHTELFAERTNTEKFYMMLAGDRLKVVLVTIHTAIKNVAQLLNKDIIISTIKAAEKALKERFGITSPNIAVAGLNPHSGEKGLFGKEEIEIIEPAIKHAAMLNIKVSGPHPPDTVFYHAVNGCFDAVICMYHDQGLIPFKLIHFKDGVNTTLGLPIIRTSVDHGTAYDIAGKGIADSTSLEAAIKMAVKQSLNKGINYAI